MKTTEMARLWKAAKESAITQFGEQGMAMLRPDVQEFVVRGIMMSSIANNWREEDTMVQLASYCIANPHFEK